MKHDTPAIEIRAKDRERNTAAFLEAFSALRPRRFTSALDIRYGLGGWAEAIADRIPAYVGFEADPATAAQAVKPKGVMLLTGRFPPSEAMAVQPPFALLLADFNNLTLMKPFALLEAIQFAKPRAIVFTDVACSKLHLNFGSYGLESPDLASYVRAFRDRVLPDWTHVHTARHHHHAATLAFVKE